MSLNNLFSHSPTDVPELMTSHESQLNGTKGAKCLAVTLSCTSKLISSSLCLLLKFYILKGKNKEFFTMSVWKLNKRLIFITICKRKDLLSLSSYLKIVEVYVEKHVLPGFSEASVENEMWADVLRDLNPW